MQSIRLTHPTRKVIGKLVVPGSKSESNRLLILRQLYFPRWPLENLSTSSDTLVMQRCLKDRGNFLHARDAGTVMRFLTAYLAVQPGQEYVLQGSGRMHQRPVSILVEALRQLGGQIEYLDAEGFPPLKIYGQQLRGGHLDLDGSVSSQYISALMMVAPGLARGLTMRLRGMSVSAPYIYLTGHLMQKLGFEVKINPEEVHIAPFVPATPPAGFAVEPDWSAASYWFLVALLAAQAEIYLPGFKQHSLQGDAFVSRLFEPLGVEAHFIGAGFRLRKGGVNEPPLAINLLHNPDLAPTMAVAYAACQRPVRILGLQTLRIKESDRIAALQKELSKTGAEVLAGPDFLEIRRGIQQVDDVVFDTYGDHRMAMALAPLALLGPVVIREPKVVGKSYKSYWQDLERLGFVIEGRY